MGNSNKIILINKTTNERLGFADKGVLSKHIHVPLNTIANWFRDGVKEVNHDNYVIFQLDYYYPRTLRTKGISKSNKF